MTLAPLATIYDVESRLGRNLSDTESARVGALLRDASVSVRNYMRQDITEATTTERLRVRNGRVLLPQRPVTAVTAAANVAGGPAAYQWDGFDRIYTASNVPDPFGWEPFRNGITAVNVTYTHGYAVIPDDIVGVVCSIVIRALGREPVDAGLVSETIQGYSYQLGSAAAAGGFGMLQAERDILDTYQRVGGRIDTSPGMIV